MINALGIRRLVSGACFAFKSNEIVTFWCQWLCFCFKRLKKSQNYDKIQNDTLNYEKEAQHGTKDIYIGSVKW